MKVYIETLGCQMNRLDSELMAGVLRAAGHEPIATRAGAQVVLYNTCSVRQHAEDKVYSRLGADGQRKAAGKHIIVGVLGCMAQAQGAALRQKYPQVDFICGPGQLGKLPALIAQAAAGTGTDALDPARSDAPDLAAQDEMDAVDLARDPSPAPSGAQAFVRVMRGCDKFCSYCIVPFVRGPERSRDPSHVVEESRRLVDSGISEITLLGQTVNSYHWQGEGNSYSFADLLARVSAIAGLRRLRFVTSHPIDFGDDILQAMRDLPNVCQYIHCPAQSGSDAVLARMNRKYTRGEYDDLVDRARAIVPGVVLAGDFIVGFPGESEDDHQASADLIRRSAYKTSFIFKYSPRPGTMAAKRYPDDISDAVKRRRNNDLLAVQHQVGQAHHDAYVGRTLEVLVEGPSPRAQRPSHGADLADQLVGRTRWDHIVIFNGAKSLANTYRDVQITAANSLTLFGELAP